MIVKGTDLEGKDPRESIKCKIDVSVEESIGGWWTDFPRGERSMGLRVVGQLKEGS